MTTAPSMPAVMVIRNAIRAPRTPAPCADRPRSLADDCRRLPHTDAHSAQAGAADVRADPPPHLPATGGAENRANLGDSAGTASPGNSEAASRSRDTEPASPSLTWAGRRARPTTVPNGGGNP